MAKTVGDWTKLICNDVFYSTELTGKVINNATVQML